MHKARVFLISSMLTVLLALAGLLGLSEPAAPASLQDDSIGNVTTRFNASRDGFAFINHAGADPNTFLGRTALAGLCGGMSYAALDYFFSGRPPAAGDIHRFLVVRDIQGMLANGVSFVRWTLAPDTPSNGYAFGVATSTRKTELPRLAAALRRGPVPIGLVKARELDDIGENHVVVAYGLERKGSIARVRIYDPNHPRSDDTYLKIDLSKSGGMALLTDGHEVDSWRGFFVERYSPARPPAGS